MPDAINGLSSLRRFATVYFWLIVLIGNIMAGYVVVTETGFSGVVQAVLHGGSIGHIFSHAFELTQGTLLGNPTFYLLLGLGVLAELTHIPLPKGGVMSASFLIAFAALLMLGLPAAILVAGVAAIATVWLQSERRWPSAFFNTGQYALAYMAASAALNFHHVFIPGFPGPDDYGHVAMATAAFLAVNFLIVDVYLGLAKAMSPWQILWEDDRTEIVVTLALAPVALLMATMHQSQEWWGVSLVLIPMFATAYFVRLFLQVKQAHHELAAYNEQLRILQEVATRISSQIDLEQTLTLISQEIRRVVGYHDCMIFLLDDKTRMLDRQITADPFLPKTPLQLPLDHGLIGLVAREKETILKHDLALQAMDVGVLSGFRSLLAVPIQTEKQVLGVLALLHRETQVFQGSDERLLKVLASQAAVAIKNAQLYRATQQLAVTDGLTKVYNRRYFEEQLASEIERARRHGHTTSLVILDVDHFKKFNDTHGHLLGDHVLQGVARVLQKSTRETDLVARYGGEEFVVILPETPPEDALMVAERIRRNIKAHPFWGRQQTPLQVTASVGLVSDPAGLLELKPLIDQADTCLYQAKKQGRDRVCATVYAPDQPLQVTESRQEEAPEPTLRRPTRQVGKMSVEDWERYMGGNVEGLLEDWWSDARVDEVLGSARRFWTRMGEEFVRILVKNLGASEEERNSWLDRGSRNPLARPIQTELARLVENGVSITQMEYAILAFYKKMQAMVQGAPFSLEERMTVVSVQERLFHVLQLMVSQVWHDYFQATSENLYLIAELESRLGADFEPVAVLEEIAALTAKALGGDACLVLVPDEDGKRLVVEAAWGMAGIDRSYGTPADQGLAGICFTHHEVLQVASLLEDTRVYRPFYEQLYQLRPVQSLLMVPLVHEGRSLGLLYCMSERRAHFTPLDVRLAKGIGARLAVAMQRHQQEADRQARFLAAIAALAEALEQRDAHKGQPNKLMGTATTLAAALGLPDREIEALKQASRLHDIGELGVPDAVFSKPGPLSPEEQKLVRSHPLMGAKILGYIEALRDVVPIVRHHHERMDGSGYPDGLKGEEIPILARVLAVADAYDAMTTPRAYRQAMTHEQAMHELRRSGAYDPAILDRLEQLVTSGSLPAST
ncbi:MAG: diguanylate cyclase [Candidatus Sericytochromatia bacterium]